MIERVAAVVFVLCVAFCVYTIAAYPVLLGLWARVRGRTVRKAPLRTTVSVILPVHNGAHWIGPKLDSIAALQYPPELIEILVVDDGSTDNTRSFIDRFPGRSALRLLTLSRGGKAAALNAAISQATGEILFFTDVRQTLDPDSLANLVECFSDPQVGVASGELMINDGSGREEASVGMYWKYEKFIRKNLSRLDSMPGATGCIYAMRRCLARPLPEDSLVDDMYLPIGAFFAGYRVILDETARAFDYPTQLASEFRRKVRTLAGVCQIIGQYPALLGPRNRMWIHFVSHKLARLVMPWALIAAAGATWFMAEPWNYWAGAAQAAGYGLGLVDPWVKDSSPLKHLTSPARTFMALMIAALCAVCVVFIPARKLWGETRVRRTQNSG
ncbi:MAG TPA: glycosyltransferase family 2 protein [Candidatus Acidoferrales bacterium]|nr:glycosyltransferase family 2 protein [Candidatus Acidoferrales bacterium]